MLKGKNITPKQVTIYLALGLAALASIIVFVISSDLASSLVSFAIIALSAYFSIEFAINHFIYRKIKLIYKFISQTKATKREEFYNQELLPKKNLEDISNEVEVWAKERKNEIERLQNNEEFRREFLMNLAHELKTPIFSAQGYIETLIDGAITNPEVALPFLQKAGKSIDRLAELITDLDEISKLESNAIPLVKSKFIIQDLFHEAYEELSQKALTKNIKLIIKKGCEQPIEVFADKQRIRQVVFNLVENSINYGKHNGQTTAGFYRVDGVHAYVEITDNGIGIAEEHVSRVFERFYRTDTARTRNAGGTGLGLAIVKHIIEAHNQTLSCRSKVDVGTSFGFTLETSKSMPAKA